jgi:hypothetical protein
MAEWESVSIKAASHFACKDGVAEGERKEGRGGDHMYMSLAKISHCFNLLSSLHHTNSRLITTK